MTRFSLPLRRSALLIAGPAALLLLGWLMARIWIEWQWFGQFQLAPVLLRRWLLQLAGGLLGLGVAAGLQHWLGRIWALPQGGERRLPLGPLS